MSAEKNKTNETTAMDVVSSAPAPRSMVEIAFGIISTLVATAVGACIGKYIGGWGDRRAEVFQGDKIAAGHISSQIFGTIMAIFTGSIALHANLSNSSKPEQAKNPAAAGVVDSKSENVATVKAEQQKSPNAMIAGAALHDGPIMAENKKRAL